MIVFDFLTLKLKLYSRKDELATYLPVRVQYYNPTVSEWIIVFEGNVEDGIFSINKEVRFGSPEEAVFYDMIEHGIIPQTRIIPRDPPNADLVKQAVIGSSFVFNLTTIDDVNHFEIDFGVLYMIPNELIVDTSSTFEDILPVASFYPIPVPTDNTPIPIQNLYTNLVSEIEAANEASVDSAFKLSNISVKLKAVIHRDGETINASLLDLENCETVCGDAISELNFDITPVQMRETSEIAVPNLIGLTESAVRKIVKANGLRLNSIYQKRTGAVNGDSFKQSPTSGVTVKPNQLITVMFNKNE